MSIQRLQKELYEIEKNPNNYFAISASYDIYQMKATIIGPEKTPYDGQEYHLYITVPKRYPFSPPIVKFAQPCYHPNVSSRGDICLDILKAEKWSPIQNISSILISIISFLSDPNTSSPLNPQAATMHDKNIEKYVETVKKVYLMRDNKSFKNFPKIRPVINTTLQISSSCSTCSPVPDSMA